MIESIDALATLGAALQQTAGQNVPTITPKAAAALAVGLAALGSGYAERGIGAAAVGAIAEDRDLFGTGLILTVLPETLVILALVVVFVVPDWTAVVA
jgi:V/A-type H+-transporting ATPase subunit K